MHELSSRDGDYEFDWGKTSQDYARYRPGPPPCFYDRLAALNAVTPADRVLDLGTGTGLLAREFARRGSQVAALDQSAMQIEMCWRRTCAQRLLRKLKYEKYCQISAAIVIQRCWGGYIERQRLKTTLRLRRIREREEWMQVKENVIRYNFECEGAALKIERWW